MRIGGVVGYILEGGSRADLVDGERLVQAQAEFSLDGFELPFEVGVFIGEIDDLLTHDGVVLTAFLAGTLR